MQKRLFIIVLDSFGIGEAPDAALYGDAGSDTLYAVSQSAAFHVPNLARLGLFNIEGARGGSPAEKPQASFARMREQSAGKDTIIGHWEIAGVISQRPLPTYPQGFPPEIREELSRLIHRGVLCGLPYSGTQVLLDYGREHLHTGSPIVYTSADSVMQIAAHEQVIPLQELYEICALARKMMQGERAVGRVIARPFTGDYPDYVRTRNRHDYALAPPSRTMLDVLSKHRLDVIGVGKIYDIFAGSGVTESILIQSNDDGMRKTIHLADQEWSGLCFVNLVDFDTVYGHRNDVDGYARAMSGFDLRLGELVSHLRPDDTVILTADHGCDPATPSTDHSREYTPMLLFGEKIRPGINLGTRATFADIAATTQEYFGLPVETQGKSFLRDVLLD
jgi:phosphopentomutase